MNAGNYFVGIPGSNFGAGQPLVQLSNSPIPGGVGDTQSDNRSHGAVPSGGTLTTNGVVSTRINLQMGAEPTMATANPDDDADSDSDMTIDFGFWHSYSLGNRVWIDLNNSATIDGPDGGTPGVAGVTVNLLNTSNAVIATTTTDASGYYRFDNLNAGSYKVEIPASNFGAGQPLEGTKVSSINTPESNNPNDSVDSNDDGINPVPAGTTVRTGLVTLGIGASEPLGESDLSGSGQGTIDAFANMTVDLGFTIPPYKGDTVYYDYDSDQVQDSNEPGIANVTVWIYTGGADSNLSTTGDNVLVGTATTNSQGKYLFANLTSSTPYRVEVDTTDVAGTPTTVTFFHNPPLAPAEAFLTDDFGFVGTGTLGNQVWKEVVDNGTYNPAEGDSPISGLTVELYTDLNGNGVIDGLDDLVATTTTAVNGQYQFGNLILDDNIAGNGVGAQYTVRVVDPGSLLNGLERSVGPTPGANNNSQTPTGYGMTLTGVAPSNQTGDFGYHGLGSVGDTVWYDVNSNGLKTPNEPVLAGITVTLTYPGPDGNCATAGDNIVLTDVTDANGNYLFDELLGGEYCISITPPSSTTITTNNQGQQFTLDDGEDDLTRDFGVVGNGVIGNQIYIDYNNDGNYDTPGDVGVPGVTFDLYYDTNGNGVRNAGELVIKSTTTDSIGRYQFTGLLTDDGNAANGPGAPYIVVVSDTAGNLTYVDHVPGVGTSDNESKEPTGYAIQLTLAATSNQTGDFGYLADADLVDAPLFLKKHTVSGNTIHYTLTWINLSNVIKVDTAINDSIPAGTTYVPGSLQCQAEGLSGTSSCAFNAAQNRIEWRGIVDPDPGSTSAADADNEIVIQFDVTMASATNRVSNQGFGCYDQNGDNIIDEHDGNVVAGCHPSNNVDTPEPDDPNINTRDPLASTGQAQTTVLFGGVALIVASIVITIMQRRFIKARS